MLVIPKTIWSLEHKALSSPGIFKSIQFFLIQVFRNNLKLNITVFPKIGVPQNGWFIRNTLLKWMIWGYHYFGKPHKDFSVQTTFFGRSHLFANSSKTSHSKDWKMLQEINIWRRKWIPLKTTGKCSELNLGGSIPKLGVSHLGKDFGPEILRFFPSPKQKDRRFGLPLLSTTGG